MEKTTLKEHANYMLFVIAHKDKGTPSGHLYAVMMQHMDIEHYQALITLFSEKGLITIKGHLIKPTLTLKQLFNKG